MTELLGEFLRIKRHTAQFLRPDQLDRDKKNSAEESELRVLREDFRLRRDVQIFAAPARFQVLLHDSAYMHSSLLNPEERDGIALAAEKHLELRRIESRNKFQILALKNSCNEFLRTSLQIFTFMRQQRLVIRKIVTLRQIGAKPHEDHKEKQDTDRQSSVSADHGRTALAR